MQYSTIIFEICDLAQIQNRKKCVEYYLVHRKLIQRTLVAYASYGPYYHTNPIRTVKLTPGNRLDLSELELLVR